MSSNSPVILETAGGLPVDSTTLKSDHFSDTPVKKTMVVLHQTEGGSVKSSFDWLTRKYTRVMPAFWVERDGTIYQSFPADRWAFHLGKGVPTPINRQSIAIEIANFGPLRLKGDKLFQQYSMIDPFCLVSETEKYEKIEPYYRDYGYFEKHPVEQMAAVKALVHELCEQFGIPKVFVERPWFCDPTFQSFKPGSFKGVIHHGRLRPDKLDVSPAFPVAQLGLDGNWAWPEL